MIRHMVSLVFLAAASLSLLPAAPAQEMSKDEIKRQTDRAAGLQKQGKNAEAAVIYEKVLHATEVQFGKDSVNTATMLNTLANAYYFQKLYAKAEPLYQRSLQIRETKLAPDHVDVASSLNNLANLHYALKQYTKAEPLYQRCLKIRETKLGADHLDVAHSLQSLANLYRTTEQYANAEPLLARCLRIREAKLEKGHPDVLESLGNLARVYQSMGQHEKAEPLQQRVVKHAEGKHGKDNIKVAAAVHDLAGIYYALGQYAQAEPLYLRELRLREANPGNELGVAGSLNSLANTYMSLTQYAKAEPLFQRSLQIREAKLPRNHADIATSLYNLALLYSTMGQYTKAEPLFERSLQIRESKFGKDSPAVASSLHGLANLYQSVDRSEKAETLFLRSLDIRERKLSKDHVDVATSLNSLANLYRVLGQYAKAEPLYERSLQIRESKLGKDHPTTATSANDMGNLYVNIGQYAKAEAFFLRSVKIREDRYGKDHLSVATPLGNLAGLYRILGQDAKAEANYLRSVNVRVKQLGKDHPSVAISKCNLGSHYAYLKKYDLAETNCLDSIRIWEVNQLSHHYRMGLALSTLSGVYQAQKKYDEALLVLQRSEAILRKAGGETHPNVAMVLHNKAKIHWAKDEHEPAISLLQQALEIYRARLGQDHPRTNHAMSLLANFLNQSGQSAEALRTMDRSVRALRLHTAQVLPSLSESEQLRFLKTSFQEDFFSAVSLGIQAELSEENQLRSAGWVLNGKSIAQQSLVERLLLVRDNQSAEAKQLLAELVEVRRRLARSNLRDPDRTEEARFRKEIEALREKEKTLEHRLHAAGLTNRQDPWIEIDELRRKLPADAVYVDFLRFTPTDSADLLGQKQGVLAPIYVAWISSHKNETKIVNLGSAEKIDAAIRAARQELQAAHARITDEGEVNAEKMIRKKMGAVSKLILEPLLPHLQHYPQWILGPDGNLWLIPWGCLPLDAQHYVIEKHTLRYVTSGRDLVLNPLQLDQKASAPAIFADPDFDFQPSKITRNVPAPDGGPGLRDAVIGKQLKGQIEDKNFWFEFQTAGQLIIRDKDAKGPVVGQGTWKIQAQQLIMQTTVSRFEGNVQGNKIAGHRTKRKEDGTTSRDRWHVEIPEEQSLAWLRDADVRATFAFGKVARLPGTAAEAEAITPALAKLARTPPRRFLEEKATVSAFQKLKGPRVLVVSTHGYFLPDQEVPENARDRFGDMDAAAAIPGLENPLLRTGLLLAGCNHASKIGTGQDSGVLTGLEIVGTDLRGTELVVLSACETGLGDIRNGEGVAGLRQAFHLAGARAVVASLWKIPDRETALLMKSYFEKMSAGQNKVDALRAAQLNMLRERRARTGAAHPFYWAAFTLTGQ